MRTLIKGEKRYIPMLVRRRTESAFEVDSVSVKVRDENSNIVETIDPAEVDGKTVFFLCDTTQDIYEADKTYDAYFAVTIVGLPKVIKNIVKIKVAP